MNKELHAVVTEVETELQNARGELSVFEDRFPTDSPQAELIRELLDRLDEASDPDEIEEHVRDYSDDFGVGEEEVFVQDVREGDIVLNFGNPAECVRRDGWHTSTVTGGYYETELTLAPYRGEEFTTTHTNGAKLRVALRDA